MLEFRFENIDLNVAVLSIGLKTQTRPSSSVILMKVSNM